MFVCVCADAVDTGTPANIGGIVMAIVVMILVVVVVAILALILVATYLYQKGRKRRLFSTQVGYHVE